MRRPPFYDPDQVQTIYLTRSAQIASEAAARPCPVDPAAPRVAALGIDPQLDFCHPDGALFVPGAIEDTRRSVEWIYDNLEQITDLYFSLDTHSAHQIFHPAWWEDAQGKSPPPLTVITAEDVESGRWRARREPEASLRYCQQLSEQGNYVLTIWPFHCLQGGLGQCLVPALHEAALYHSLCRGRDLQLEQKGQHPLTENFSVLSPEVTQLGSRAVGCFNQDLYDRLMSYDRVYVFGQARSHCVLSTLIDLKDRILESDPSLMQRIYFLDDASSSVPAPPLQPLPPELDFPAVAERVLQELAELGMQRVRCADGIVAAS